ncbi:MAG: RsmE family RNA methyltransferase [Leptospirales bacterium]|jgi:16S rRNA (uracil1498-N3)-methyltransferase
MFLIFREVPGAFPESFELASDEYRHLRARRVRPGGAVHVGDGRGRRLAYRLADNGDLVQRSASRIEQGDEAPVELFTAVPEGRRWDWLLQKATELGATAIQPIQSEYSESRRLKREREERIIMEAAVQSRRFVLPELREALPLPEALRAKAAPGETRDAGIAATKAESPARSPMNSVPGRVVLDPRGDRSFADFLRAASDAPTRLLQIFVGPEGGFSETELTEFAQAGAVVCRLGATILRVETAALAGLACVAAREDG